MKQKHVMEILVLFINMCIKRYSDSDMVIEELNQEVIEDLNNKFFNDWIENWIDRLDDYDEFKIEFLKSWKKKWWNKKEAQMAISWLWMNHAPKFNLSITTPTNEERNTIDDTAWWTSDDGVLSDSEGEEIKG